jgi:hypothetical protein
VLESGFKLRSLVLYAPATGIEPRRLFYESIAQKTQALALEDQYEIIAGDFNNVLRPEDSYGFKGLGLHSAALLEEILDESCLVDAWLLNDWAGNHEEARQKRPESYFTYRKLKQYRRLDRVYISKNLIWNIKNMAVLPCPSRGEGVNLEWDHFPVSCTLDPSSSTTPKGPGYRRLNPAILERPEIRRDVRIILETAQRLQLKWHDFKGVLLDYIFQYQDENKWVDRVDVAWRELLLVRDSEGVTDEILHIYEQKWMRTLERDAEMKKALGERRRDLFLELPSRYLSKILKSRSVDRTVEQIKDKNGNVFKDTEGILRAFQEFYTDLYAEKPIVEDSLNRLLAAWPVEPQTLQNIPNPFKKEDLIKIIKDSNPAKSPGIDGAPYGLYQIEPELFAHFLLEQFNDVWSGSTKPPESWSRSIITTLYKGGALPLDEIASRRPISLLDTDYKLFAKLVAVRLQEVLGKLILPSQNGFVKGRSIFSNILSLNEAIAKILKDDFDFPQLLLVDCEKAFDRVSHRAIRLVLAHILDHV